MSISATEIRDVLALTVDVDDDAIVVDIDDGRTISAPVLWFPRLAHATPSERANSSALARNDPGLLTKTDPAARLQRG